METGEWVIQGYLTRIGAPDFGGSSGTRYPQMKSTFEFMQLAIRLSNKVGLIGAYAVQTLVLFPYRSLEYVLPQRIYHVAEASRRLFSIVLPDENI